ncbi:MAG TPA: DUF1800 domain-containing protein [Gemmatimonadaceae bacterium]|nr:DUF1800 domain-containing protein [Gemmatimonadaceae bacterium]
MHLKASFLFLVASASVSAQAPSPRVDHRELAADQQIIQALNRLTFGPRPGDAQKVRAIGLDKWIDLQLHPDKIDDSSIDLFVKRYDILNQDQNEILGQYAEALRARRMVRRDRTDSAQITADERAMQQKLGTQRRQFVAQLMSERVARAVGSNRQLEEVMTDFWLNHFNIYVAKGPPQPYYLVEYEREVIRPNALGKFRDLLGAVAKSPAMLFYLDNARSMADSTRPRLAGPGFGGADAVARIGEIAGRGARRNRGPVTLGGSIVGSMGRGRRAIDPQQQQEMQQRLQQLRNGGLNENYGRELLELHTLGVDGGYTQQDVINVARALTGWTIRPPQAGGGFIFRPQVHDAGEKVVLGHKLAANRGIEDGEDVLDIVSRSPATARFIATKLARRFISDNPPQAVINDAAATFTKTDGDIREVVRTIITSNEFYSQQAFRSKVKSPFEVVVSAMRALNAQPDSTPRTAGAIAYLGQPLFGHQAPNGYPETGDAWMNTGAILNRINFGMAIAANRLPGVSFAALPAIDTLRNATRTAQVDAVVSILLSGSVSADTRAVLMKGENPLATTSAMASVDSGAKENDEAGNEMMRRNQRNGVNGVLGGEGQRGNQQPRGFGPVPQLSGIAQIVGLALGSPEFQRR